MSATIHPLPSIPLDAEGYPARHQGAVDAAAKCLMEMANELPDGIYHLWPTDAEWLMRCVMAVYWHHIRRDQR